MIPEDSGVSKGLGRGRLELDSRDRVAYSQALRIYIWPGAQGCPTF